MSKAQAQKHRAVSLDTDENTQSPEQDSSGDFLFGRYFMRIALLAGIIILAGCVTNGQYLNSEPYQPSAQEIANNAAMEQAIELCGEAKVGMSKKEKEKIYSCVKKNYKEKGGMATSLASISSQPPQKPCGFTQEFFGGRDCRQEQMDRALNICETRKAWVEMTECKARVMISYRNDPFTQEIFAYSMLLIEKVNNRKMTNAEAEYAIQQKVAEVNQRLSGIRAENRQLDLIEREQDMRAHQERMKRMYQKPAPVLTPTKTECRPARGLEGGFDCTTGPDSRDLLLQKLSNPQ